MAIGRLNAVFPGRPGKINNRHTGGPTGRKQFFGGINRVPGKLAAGIRKLVYQLVRMLGRIATIDEVVEINSKQCWALAYIHVPLVVLVNLQFFRRNNVLPAMIFKISGHGTFPVWFSKLYRGSNVHATRRC